MDLTPVSKLDRSTVPPWLGLRIAQKIKIDYLMDPERVQNSIAFIALYATGGWQGSLALKS